MRLPEPGSGRASCLRSLQRHGPEHDELPRFLEGLHLELQRQGVTAAELAEALGASRQQVYRRLRGEVGFSAHETLRLARAFPSAVAALSPAPNGATHQPLTLPFASGAGYSDEAYIEAVAHALERYRTLACEGEPVLISSTDLPIFPLLRHPLLAALRSYYYSGGGAELDEAFDYREYRTRHAAFIEGLAELGELYQAVDTVEVWGDRPLRSLLRQVRMLHGRRVFGKATSKAIFREIDALVDGLRRALKSGRKSGGGRFELHTYDLGTRNTVIHVCGPGGNLNVVTIDEPAFALSEAPGRDDLYAETLRRHLSRATAITRHRYRPFVEDMRAAVKKTRKAVKRLP